MATPEQVLQEYGLRTGEPDDWPKVSTTADFRVCKNCGHKKPINAFGRYHQRGVLYVRWTCKACRGTEASLKDGKLYKKQMAEAPFVAANQVLRENPEALAVLIKYFRVPFEQFYNAERDRIIKKENERRLRYQQRPQSFRYDKRISQSQ